MAEHASLTIQTTPEEAQKVIDFVKKFQQHPPMFQAPFSDCVTACKEALRVLGIDLGATWNFLQTPYELWAQLYASYSADALKAQQTMNNPFFIPTLGVPPAQAGNEYSGFDYMHFLSELLLNQQRPVRGCVTVQGPNGPEKTCDQ